MKAEKTTRNGLFHTVKMGAAIASAMCCLAAAGRATQLDPEASNDRNRPIVVTRINVLRYEDGKDLYSKVRQAIDNGNTNKVAEFLRNGFDVNTVMCIDLCTMRYPESYVNAIDTTQQERIHQGWRWMVTGSWDRHFRVGNMILPTSLILEGTPLMVACRNHNPVMVKFLLQRGANPNVWIKFKAREVKDNLSRPWLSACHYLSMHLSDVKVWERDSSKIAAIRKMLRDAGLKFVDGKDDFGRTALWDAFETLDPSWLDLLLRQKTYDPNELDGGGESFVEFLERNDSAELWPEDVLKKIREMKKLLEKYGYKVASEEGEKDEGGSGGYKFIDVK